MASNRPETDGKAARIDRIVLYIDDLDRCPAALVVEVLQAVHLLLAFELFVVVVGVDARWLLHALERQYAFELDADHAVEMDSERAWVATPRNYLEKIFQIPYWLKPMDPETGYIDLVRDLVKETREEPQLLGAEDSTSSVLMDTRSGAEEGHSNEQRDRRGRPRRAGMQDVTLKHLSSADLHPRSLELSSGEVAFLSRLGGLVSTPRAAKRLVNIYRLLRTFLTSESLDALIGERNRDPEYPAVLLLLAAVTGFPEQAAILLPRLQIADVDSWWTFYDTFREEHLRDRLQARGMPRTLDEHALDPVRWAVLTEQLDGFRGDARLESIEPFRVWASRVGRFSFQAGRVLMRSN
jgi:hypothetical protein